MLLRHEYVMKNSQEVVRYVFYTTLYSHSIPTNPTHRGV